MIAKIGIVGTGIMGSQLSEMLIEKGYTVITKTRDGASADRFMEKVKKHLGKRFSEEEVASLVSRLSVTSDYSELSGCDLVFEASVEDMDVKKDILSNLSRVCSDRTIIATNTSSLSINTMSEMLDHPENFIGCHFFNPAFKMKLVEIIRCGRTSENTVAETEKFCADIGKTTVRASDSPGFIVNRLLLPQINEAVRILDSGISTVEEIDTAVVLGLNHPMGPLALADYIGLDTCVAILNTLYEETGDPHYIPCKSLTELCGKGCFGRKSKQGFYKY